MLHERLCVCVCLCVRRMYVCSAPKRLRDALSPKLGITSARGVPVTVPVTPGALFLPLRTHLAADECSNFVKARARETREFLSTRFQTDPSGGFFVSCRCCFSADYFRRFGSLLSARVPQIFSLIISFARLMRANVRV